MWLALLCLAEILLFLRWFTQSRLYVSGLVCILYALTYTSKSERTGRRRWEWFRSLSIWSKISGITQRNWNNGDLLATYKRGPVILVTGPNLTGLGMFWAYGLHGDRVLGELDPLFAMPKLLFMIPGLRDVLLWAGAIEDDPLVIEDLIRRRETVCICPDGLAGALYPQDNVLLAVCSIPDSLLDLARDTKALLVPVVIHGEAERYPQLRMTTRRAFNLVKISQNASFTMTGYPFPLLCVPKWRNKMSLTSGCVLDVAAQVDQTRLKKTFHDLWRETGSTKDGVRLEIRPE